MVTETHAMDDEEDDRDRCLRASRAAAIEIVAVADLDSVHASESKANRVGEEYVAATPKGDLPMPHKPKGFDQFDKLARALVQVPKSELTGGAFAHPTSVKLSTKTPPKKKPRKRKR